MASNDLKAPLDSLSSSTPATIPGQDLLNQAKETAAPYVKQAQDFAAPHLAKAQELAAPHLAKAQEAAAPLIQKGVDGYKFAAQKADEAINSGAAATAQAKNQTVDATNTLEKDASATTDKAVGQGAETLESAKTYLAGVASQVSETLTSFGKTVDEKTKTADHSGIVTMAGNALSTASSYIPASVTNALPTSISSHLPSATSTATEPAGTAIADAAHSKADELEIQDALKKLASRGEETLEEAKEGVSNTLEVKRP